MHRFNLTARTVVTILVGIFAALAAGPVSKPVNRPSFFSTVDTLFAKQNYPAATTLLLRHLDSVPTDNKALFMLVTVEQTRILDYESYQVEGDLLFKKADSVKKILEHRLPQMAGRDSVRCLFYIGTIDGCISVLQAKRGELFPSLKNGIESVTLLNEVIRLDSTCREAYMGVGLFHYYLNKSFKWLPFIDANSEIEGIREIERAASAPFPYDMAAKNSLSWILIERRNNKKVDSIAREVLSIFPDNTIFLRIRCLNALWSGRYAEAVEYGEKLSRLTMNRKPENWSDLVLAYYVISSGNDGLGKEKEANAAADYILGAPIPKKYLEIPHIKKNLKKIESIRRKRQQ